VTFKHRRSKVDVLPVMRHLALALTFASLALAGCGGTTARTGAGGAEIVPADATMFIALNTDADSEQWQAVNQLANRFSDKRDLEQTVKDGLKEQGLDWETDVKPALGPEFDFVWLELDQQGQNFVVLTQPRDSAKFDRLIRKAAQTSTQLFRGQVNGWEVLAPSQAAVDQFVRESESSDSKLADEDGFNAAMSNYADDALLRFYLDGPPVMELARDDLSADDRAYVDKLGRLDWIASGLSVTSAGVRFDLNVHGKAGPALKDVVPTKPFATALTHEVPSDALAYFAFHGAKGMLTGLEDNPLFKENVPELHRYAKVLKSVESLLQGENAFYVRPAGAGRLPEVTFVAEPAPGTNGAATLDRLIKRYRSELELPSQPKRSRVAGVPAHTIDLGEYKVHYANVGNRLVITNLGAGVRALKGNPPSLADSKDFQQALDSAGMPAKTQGFVYVNVKGGLDYAQRLANTNIPSGIKQNLRPLRSVVEYAATQPSEIQVTFFLHIK
jgi:Protein of unknown function (DUF3352)